MPRRKKKKYKLKRHELYSVVGMLALIVIMVLAIFLGPSLQRLFSKTFIRFESSVETRSQTAPSDTPSSVKVGEDSRADSRPLIPTQLSLQGSFTELFAGVGWKNPLNSTIHQDFKTLTISFPPAYQFEEVNPTNPIRPVSSTGDTVTVGSRIFTAKVEKVGEQYEGYLYELADGELVPISLIGQTGPIFSSQYPGKIVFGSDSASKIFLLYAAYQGNAFEIGPISPTGPAGQAGLINDYSAIFNARVMEEGKIDPQIFYKDNTWWVFSANEMPKLLRIRSGVASDLTSDLVGLIGPIVPIKLTAVPAPEDNAIYIGVESASMTSKTYRLHDLGFKRSDKLVWESLRLNAWHGEIIRGRFSKIHAGDDGGNIRYFLSNNGGRDWVEVESNKFVQFETKGGDFRWRAELNPSDNQFQSPWIKQIGVEYYIIRK